MPSMPSVPLMRARPSLALSSTGAEPGGGQRVGGRHQGAVGVAHLALAHQRQRAVRQRGQVAGAAQRAVLAHHRRDPRRQQRRPSARPSRGGCRCARSPASRGAAASARGPPRARPRARTRRRASGPASAAAARASRPGCAGWPARRTPSRCRTPGRSPPPAPPPPPRACSIAATASVGQRHRRTAASHRRPRRRSTSAPRPPAPSWSPCNSCAGVRAAEGKRRSRLGCETGSSLVEEGALAPVTKPVHDSWFRDGTSALLNQRRGDMGQVPAATRALRVLRFLASQPEPTSIDRIMRACGLPRSTAYHLLTAMAEEGFVVAPGRGAPVGAGGGGVRGGQRLHPAGAAAADRPPAARRPRRHDRARARTWPSCTGATCCTSSRSGPRAGLRWSPTSASGCRPT